MPLVSNRPNQNAAVWEPRRLRHPAREDGQCQSSEVFASDLSVSEYVLLGEAGFEPLGGVVGSSIYPRRPAGRPVGQEHRAAGPYAGHVQRQGTGHGQDARRSGPPGGRRYRRHAAANADVHLGARIAWSSWPPGTAVRHLTGQGAHRAPDGRAFTSDLSAQDFFRLLAAGAVPVAFVLGTCVYHVAHQGVMQSLRRRANQEMLQFTQGVYEARELALTRMQAEAAAAQSSGVVGVTVEVKNHVWGEHATEFLATGTAVRRLADEHKLPETFPKPTFTLGLDH